MAGSNDRCTESQCKKRHRELETSNFNERNLMPKFEACRRIKKCPVVFWIFPTFLCNVRNKSTEKCFKKYGHYHRFPWYATFEIKTSAETFPKCPSIIHIMPYMDELLNCFSSFLSNIRRVIRTFLLVKPIFFTSLAIVDTWIVFPSANCIHSCISSS